MQRKNPLRVCRPNFDLFSLVLPLGPFLSHPNKNATDRWVVARVRLTQCWRRLILVLLRHFVNDNGVIALLLRVSTKPTPNHTASFILFVMRSPGVRGRRARSAKSNHFIGNPGTGKSHLATAIAAEACAKGYRVRFFRVTELVTARIEAKDQRTLARLKTQLSKLDLLVLDELSLNHVFHQLSHSALPEGDINNPTGGSPAGRFRLGLKPI